MSSISWLLLKVMNQIGSERSFNGIYYLLSGKKSFQTIQDAKLFHCTQYVGSLKSVEKNVFDQIIKEGDKKGWFHYIKKDHAHLSDTGIRSLELFEQVYQIPKYYNGAKYEWNDSATIFWNRLSLLVQTVSFLERDIRHFIPVSYDRNIQLFTKDVIKKCHMPLHELNKQLFDEMFQILNLFSELEAWLFVQRLTSPDRTGRTFLQLSNHFNDDSNYAKLIFQSVIHRILQLLNHHQYPILNLLYPESEFQGITETAKVTNRLLINNNIDDIAKIRNLKRSTIEDHIIELAIYDPDFPVESFVNRSQVQAILYASNMLQTKKLKKINEHFSGKFSYFEIRLALSTGESLEGKDES